MVTGVAKASDVPKIVELTDFSPANNLYLKPISRVSITVQIPLLHDSSGQLKSFTTWEIIEKLRQLCPGVLAPPTVMKVVRTTLEFVRFVAELDCKADVKRVVTSLDSQLIKLSGFPQNLRVRASETPYDCPRRHDWESFFRDAQDMDETKPGERPDTLVINGLPVRWFNSQPTNNQCSLSENSVSDDKPDLAIVKSAFETFGQIREIDIPMLDPVQNPNYFDSYILPKKIFAKFSSSFVPDTVLNSNEYDSNIGNISGFGKFNPPDKIGILNFPTTTTKIETISTELNQKRKKSSANNQQDNNNNDNNNNNSIYNSLSPLTFTAYIQYMDYTGFSRAMDGLRGQKLVHTPSNHFQIIDNPINTTNEKLYYTAEIKIDFDRTKHLSKTSIQARQVKRTQLLLIAESRRAEAQAMAEAEEERRRLLEEAERKAEARREAEALAAEAEHAARRAARAESKRQAAIERCKRIKEELFKKKIALEDYRRLQAVRKSEGIRLMTFLLAKIQVRHDLTVASRRATRLIREKRTKENIPNNTTQLAKSPEKSRLENLPHNNLKQDTTESNYQCGLSEDENDPPVECVHDSSETERVQQLLRKREEFLRNNLLEKRAEMLRTQIYQRSIVPSNSSKFNLAQPMNPYSTIPKISKKN